MAKLTIDGTEIEVVDGITVLQACEEAGVEIPRFCYHERLSIAGNCRMCLVEMEKAPKPIASCSMPVGEGMVIRTNTETVKKARNGVMEFLLINHPLDCPICDQGGECDLQDQAMAYGFDHSRFSENKRAVADKNLGPLIETHMTRCIHCTRCIRFSTEVAGVEVLGATGRGENMEVGTYVEAAISSELSANIIDLCPVGALTSKPYAFEARPWELTKTESVDVMDAVGSNIRVDSRGREVMRILPMLNEDVNEEWISDKTRYACDGLARQRLDKPYLKKDGKLQPATWQEALDLVVRKISGLDGGKIAAIAGDMCDAESMVALKGLMDELGSPNIDCRQDGAKLSADNRSGYLFNTTIAGIEDADACLIVGSNPRLEAPIINARLRKRASVGGFRVGIVGENVDLTYRTEHLGAGPQTLREIADGTHPFCETLKSAERPMIIVGQGALARADGAAILAKVFQITSDTGMVSADWNGFNILHLAASRVAGLDLGLVPGKGGRDVAGILEGAASGDIELVYLLGADEIDTSKLIDAFVIYQGHHGDAGAHAADVILPGAAYTEKDGTYANTEGRVQRGRRATFPPGDAREDWTILRALSESLGKTLPYNNIGDLRTHMVGVSPALGKIDTLTPSEWCHVSTSGDMSSSPFKSPVQNFYMTDPISRASKTMAACTETFIRNEEKTGTDG
ncbi:MAG: NADH-quinone oxidoreductase chain 3 [Alphaproteobacteria bacterium MarineAlpha11_Bin1]|nr:MAG: NADH-quinone oxidoreductase chain 3 [Alphaproteobacteria bacterium MarineAlpha11_Bin1]|tara:strand:- start:2291 stop:4351 length:2061 start_codon:yes stop_codon:yes gene_type:complete